MKGKLYMRARIADSNSCRYPQFCPACSRRQYSLWAGWKRACASGLGSACSNSSFAKPLLVDGKNFDEDGKGDCPTTSTLSNFSVGRRRPGVNGCPNMY